MKSEPFERVTLKMLRYFYEVAQTKHFTKAAENLNITNSPLSIDPSTLTSQLISSLCREPRDAPALHATSAKGKRYELDDEETQLTDNSRFAVQAKGQAASDASD